MLNKALYYPEERCVDCRGLWWHEKS